MDQAAESLDEATACLHEYMGRLDSTSVLVDGGTYLTDKGTRILDSATESLDYGSQCMPRMAKFTHGHFGFGIRFLLDDARENGVPKLRISVPSRENHGSVPV